MLRLTLHEGLDNTNVGQTGAHQEESYFHKADIFAQARALWIPTET